jgi:hypothetical protein
LVPFLIRFLKKEEPGMRRAVLVALALVLLGGCAAVITPQGSWLEPLPAAVVVAPPVLAPGPPGGLPPGIAKKLRPLPAVILVPGRYLYLWGGLYYYYWEGTWYVSLSQKGPWHRLPRAYYPKEMKRKGPPGRGRGRPFGY